MVNERQQRRKNAILDYLKTMHGPVPSGKIADQLVASGYDVSERTVRLYLKEMDQEGLTENLGRKGRAITPAGVGELDAARLLQRVGLFSAKIDQITYRMSFDLHTCSGTVVVNTTVVEPEKLLSRVDLICKVFARGYAMGTLCSLIAPGERVGEVAVPEGQVGLCTVCSITLNGVLLKHGVPTHSRFGALLEMQQGKPVRFVEMITYDGTSIDPLEIFIRSGMTNYVGAVTEGNGRIGASFREVPADSRDLVVQLAERLDAIGLGGFMRIGHASQPLLKIPVSEGRSGAVVIGGLNPVAILEETGGRVYSRAMSGLLEFNRLFRYEELAARLKAMA